MGVKWTTTSAMKEFLRREADILKRHRMPQDVSMDMQELLNTRLAPGNNGSGQASTDMTNGAMPGYGE